MSKLSPYIQKRVRKLTNFDSIRKLKILEMFQYNFVGFILVTILAYFSNQYFFKQTYNSLLEKHKTNNIKDKSYIGFFILCTITMLETFLIIVMLFYMRKVLLVVPSISSYLNKKFKALTTLDSVIQITLSFLFIQFLSGYRGKMSLILDYEFDEHF